ncbi:MAG: Exodeoxyribonuclease 7 large subunit [Candidatus Magasanikbacteria bacterium GW2011_GWA2_37_8]|uniref:Exodeoxyribonuclease 7 large subunit n=1 Tax=Candidatus Magasanikbacteria bacterium GW2011_GWA2_37_8 TaxID=1619036 RepID=A0A0G0HFE1_9BACT|nr:MAG: Exodeoxyribonuclease 7 large subunit [Candidatus Magasanikbacteria bacterium GW2011_GWA2_37_8]
MIPILSVSEFIEQINGIIAGEFLIEGEISQYKISQGKWIFFDLKDDKAVVNCFATLYNLTTPLEDGMKVRVLGYAKIREQSGRFSLTVQKVELVGEGSLKKAYLLLKEKLTKEGLFAPERKRQISEIPTRIGVIASRDSAAWGDFWRILNNRWRGVEVLLKHVNVQGDLAVSEVVEAFVDLNNNSEKCDVIVLIRGGGSLEDLAAFNSEEVVRAIYGSKIPVICGVGHERDESLADFAADVRASTPSNAAEIVVPDRSEFISNLDFTLDHLVEKINHQITKLKRGLEQKWFQIANCFETPLQNAKRLIEKFNDIVSYLANNLASKKAFVLSSERLFKNVNPKQVLKRGFSIARNSKGQIIRRANQMDIGDEMMVELSEGIIWSEVVKQGYSKKEKHKQAQLL